jgi:hypothetical protein
MLLVVESANTDLPLYSFCNEPLIGSKYECSETTRIQIGWLNSWN